MHILHYQLVQAIEIILVAEGILQESQLLKVNQEIFDETIAALPTGISKELIVSSFLQERDKYYIKEGIKLPTSTEPHKEYYYAMCSKEEVGDDPMFQIVDKDYYDNEGYIYDRHIMAILLSNLDDPSKFEDEIDEVAESLFEAMNMTRKETLAFLAGIPNFIHNPKILG